jgi:hypothetical protein
MLAVGSAFRSASRICAPDRRCDTSERGTSLAWAADNETLFLVIDGRRNKSTYDIPLFIRAIPKTMLDELASSAC